MNYYERQEQKALEQVICWLYAVGLGVLVWVILEIVS